MNCTDTSLERVIHALDEGSDLGTGPDMCTFPSSYDKAHFMSCDSQVTWSRMK